MLHQSVLTNDFGIPACAQLRCPALRGEVDVDDAKALCITLGPLEVVHERPEKITAAGETFRDSPVNVGKVVAQVFASVEVRELSLRVRRLFVPGPVFSD